MIRISRNEKARVKKEPNARPLHPRTQHLKEVLQGPAQVTKSHTVLQADEEIRTLPPSKIEISHKLPVSKK
jgi:hypothetical protein